MSDLDANVAIVDGNYHIFSFTRWRVLAHAIVCLGDIFVQNLILILQLLDFGVILLSFLCTHLSVPSEEISLEHLVARNRITHSKEL